MESAAGVFEITRAFPREEMYSLTDQSHGSSRAITAMIAEAWAHRPCKASFISKIDDALREAMETQSWVDHALASRYISHAIFDDLDKRYQSIGGILSRMIDRASPFCKYPSDTGDRSLQEEPAAE